MNREIRTAGCLAILLFWLLASAPTVADFAIDWWTTDGGGPCGARATTLSCPGRSASPTPASCPAGPTH